MCGYRHSNISLGMNTEKYIFVLQSTLVMIIEMAISRWIGQIYLIGCSYFFFKYLCAKSHYFVVTFTALLNILTKYSEKILLSHLV
jgi:hypothetical protein